MYFSDSYVVITPGVKLGVAISNSSSKSVQLTGFRLICGKTRSVKRYTLDGELAGGTTNYYQVTISTTIYSPIAEFSYQYEGNTYTASAQYNGSF